MTDFEKELMRHIDIQSVKLTPDAAVVLKVDTEKVDLANAVAFTNYVQNHLGNAYKVFFLPKDIDIEQMCIADLLAWKNLVDKKIEEMEKRIAE